MPPETINFIFRGTNLIKLGVIRVLREIFTTDLVDERFRYNPEIDKKGGEDEKTQIRIYRAYPNRPVFYPCIIARVQSFNAPQMALGEFREDASNINDPVTGAPISESFTGHIVMPVEFTVYAKSSSDDRENIFDILLMIFKVLQRDAFHKLGLGHVTINTGGEGEFEDEKDQKMIYTNSIVLHFNTDYTLELTNDQSLLINNCAVKVFGQEFPGAKVEVLAPS